MPKLRRMVVGTFPDGSVRIVDEIAPNQWGEVYILPERPKDALSNNPGYFEWLMEDSWRLAEAILILSAFVASILALVLSAYTHS